MWNCLELDSDLLRGRVREYLQTIFKLGMYRYYLEKYILDHVLQIFRGGGGGIAVISLFNEEKESLTYLVKVQQPSTGDNRHKS